MKVRDQKVAILQLFNTPDREKAIRTQVVVDEWASRGYFLHSLQLHKDQDGDDEAWMVFKESP